MAMSQGLLVTWEEFLWFEKKVLRVKDGEELSAKEQDKFDEVKKKVTADLSIWESFKGSGDMKLLKRYLMANHINTLMMEMEGKSPRPNRRRPVHIKKEKVYPHLLPLEDWLNLTNHGGKKELLAFKNEMWASDVGPRMVMKEGALYVRILALNPRDPLMRDPVLELEGKIIDTAEGKVHGVEKEVYRL